MRLIQPPQALLDMRLNYRFWDDFDWYITPHFWTSLSADAGVTAPAQTDNEWGQVTMATGATDNNEVMVRSTNAPVLWQADATHIFEARIQYAEAATNAANVFVGLASAAGANLLVDDGGNVRASGSIMGIYKIDGGTVWRCNSRNGATVNDTVALQTAGGTAFQTLTVIARDVDGTNYEITYFLDGAALTDSNNKAIKHTLAFASPTACRLVAGYIKAGGATSETLLLDYCACFSLRV